MFALGHPDCAVLEVPCATGREEANFLSKKEAQVRLMKG